MPFTPEAPAYLRSVRFSPYVKGATFVLHVWDTYRCDHYGKSVLGYRLTMKEVGRPRVTLFEGEDFHCSPMHAIDSDDVIEGIMGFLTLRRGDTDAEYFEGSTEAQMDYRDAHAEALSCEVMNWYEERKDAPSDDE